MSFETLLFLLAVALVVWANFVKPLLRRRGPRGRGRGAPERPAPGSVPGSPPESTSDAQRGPEPDPVHGSPPRWPPRPSPGPRVVPRAAELRRLSPADLRGIVVLTTVLGPCRALDDARRDPTRPD